jgi:VIT1/CCC1 family predicted Fe2+/Mn2+ transporter
VVPFLFADDARRALRLSNAVAVAMLFAAGWAFGKVAGCRPWLTGLAMVAIGVVLVAVTIAFGG